MTAREEFETWFDDWRREAWAEVWKCPEDAPMPSEWCESYRSHMEIAWKASHSASLEEAAKECEKAYSYDPEALDIAGKVRALKEN